LQGTPKTKLPNLSQQGFQRFFSFLWKSVEVRSSIFFEPGVTDCMIQWA